MKSVKVVLGTLCAVVCLLIIPYTMITYENVRKLEYTVKCLCIESNIALQGIAELKYNSLSTLDYSPGVIKVSKHVLPTMKIQKSDRKITYINELTGETYKNITVDSLRVALKDKYVIIQE